MPQTPINNNDGQSEQREMSTARRSFLVGASTALVSGLAGCNNIKQREYVADPAALAPDAAEIGFRPDQDTWVEYGFREEVAGSSLEITLSSYGATYDGSPIALAVTATPAAEEAGQKLNPIAWASFRDLLTDEVGSRLRDQVDLGIDTDTAWARGPDEIDSTGGQLLGTDVEVKTFLGVTTDDEVVLIHITRTVDREDAVFVGSGRSRPIDPEEDRPLIDEETGVFLPGEVEEGLDTFSGALEHVIREEASGLADKIPTFEVAPAPVVDWPVEELGGGIRRYEAVLETGERFVLEDPDRYQLETDRAPYYGEDVSRSVDSLDLEPLDARTAPDKVSLRSDQTSLKNQGRRGTCVVFCIVGAMEAEFNRQGETLDLDEQYGQHINKMTYLHSNPDGGITRSNVRADGNMTVNQDTLNGFENFLGLGGGGSLRKQLAMYERYGMTEGVLQYRGRSNADYSSTNQNGDDPRHQWNDPSSATQKHVNDYNLADEETTIQIPSSVTYTPFPQEALENARYRIDGYGHERSPPDGYSDWSSFIEDKLATDRTEVLISTKVGNCVNGGDVWTNPSDTSGSCGAHCMSIVGYDTTGDQNIFLAKNSWNTYNKLSYNYVDNQVIDAGWIKNVEKRPADEFYKELFLGRWTLNYDGFIGTLDIRRLGDFFDAGDLGGEQDKRLGEFFDFNDDMYRVNGETQTTGHGGEIEFYIDELNPYCAYDYTAGKHFTGRLGRDEPRLMAGTFERPNGKTAPFYASKDGNIGSTADSNWVSVDAMVGEWKVHSPILGGHVGITSTSSGGSLSGRYYYEGDFFQSTNGTLDTSTNSLTLEMPDGSGNRWEFDGYVHENDRGTASGFVSSQGGNERYPVVLARQGPANVGVEITSPDDGATLQVGSVQLSATVTEDGQQVPGAGVVWTLNGPYDPGGSGGTIIGRGTSATAKIGSGTHQIYATYPTGETVVDTITVSVNSQQAPNLSITNPSDGDYWGLGAHDGVSGNPYKDVNAQGSATASDGTQITGNDLEWSVREDGDSSWRSTGTGESTTVRLYDKHCSGTGYEIRLQATDSDGNTGTEIVSLWVNLFGC